VVDDMILRQMVGSRRNRDREGGPPADDAVDVHRTAVQVDQLVHEREPDSRPLVAAAARPLDAMESLEDVLVLGDARAGVAHGELCASVTPAQANRDLALERELERVRHEVEDDLLPVRAIDVDSLGKRRAVHDELQPGRLDERREGRGDAARFEASREIVDQLGASLGDDAREGPTGGVASRDRCSQRYGDSVATTRRDPVGSWTNPWCE
jgi:hypothetical protein